MKRCAIRVAWIAVVVLALSATHTSASVRYTVTDLGALGGRSSRARAINEAGQVVGVADTGTVGSVYRAFLWSEGTVTDLGSLGGLRTEAYDINESGQVVGFSTLSGYSTSRAFLWSEGVMSDLGTLGGSGASALGINDAGEVVGWASAVGTQLGFRWADGQMTMVHAQSTWAGAD